MAKKGVSEINGFVSVQNDERKITSKKVVKRDSSVTAYKSNASSNSKNSSKPQLSDPQKLKKPGEVDPKLKKSTIVDPKRRSNEPVTSKTQSSNIKKTVQEESKNPSKQARPQDLSKAKRNDSQGLPKSTKPTNTSVDKVKTSSVSTSKVAASQSPKSEKKGIIDPRSKGTRPNEGGKTKGATMTQSTRKTQASKQPAPSSVKAQSSLPVKAQSSQPVKAQSSQPVKAQSNLPVKVQSSQPVKARSSQPVKAQNSQPVKDSNNTTVPKLSKSISKKEIDTSKAISKDKSSRGSSKQVVNDKVTNLKDSDRTRTKEKVSSNLKGLESVEEKMTINSLTKYEKNVPEEVDSATRYKDLIYFEVDMGKGNETPMNNEITEVVEPILKFDLNVNETSDEKKMPSKKDVLRHSLSAVSRQGTFTKEDSENNNDSLNLPVIDNIEPESKVSSNSSNDEYDYEDDFEDYESDFEEYVSESGVSSESESLSDDIKITTTKTEPIKDPVQKETRTGEKTVEEEKKLDSGSYDLTTKLVLPQSVREKQLAQIKEAISRENTLFSERREIQVPVEENKEVVILDFLGALKKQEIEEGQKKNKNRSTLILEMIDLHVQEISLYEQEFFFLGEIDSLYKNRNVSHVGTEAEILKRDEDSQTDNITVWNKWTQFPLSYHSLMKDNPLESYIEDRRGFGGDGISTDINSWMNPYYNPEKLYNFIESAGQVILIMLEEQEKWLADGSVSVHKAKHDHGFSRGYIPIQTKNLQFLKSRPIVDVLFSPHNPNIFLSSHRFVKDIENITSFEDQFLGRSVICLWNILEPSQPLSMFVASCQVSAITFDIVHSNLFYAGLTDGSICLWDTSERSIYHMETVAGSMDFLIRTPTYCSSYLSGDEYHSNVVVSIESLGYEIKGSHSIEKFSPTQVVSLDSDGKVIIWVTVVTVSQIDSDYSLEKQDFGQVFWGRFKLIASKTLTPANNLPLGRNSWSLQFLCMSLTPLTDRSILIGTNNGYIVHCSLSEEKAAIPMFCSEEESDCTTSILSIEKSPHNLPIFLAGCSNGTVRIHSMDRKRPLRILMMDSQMKGVPVTKIRWSYLGAGMFFALDKTISLHIWDLCKSESAPLLTLPLKKLKATHFDISSDKKYVYIALVVNKDRLEIHRLKEQFTPDEDTVNNKDKEKFILFIDKCCY